MSEYWMPTAEDEWMLLKHPYAEICDYGNGWHWSVCDKGFSVAHGGPAPFADAQNAAALREYEEEHPDARLIAAAPEMLEALRLVREVDRYTGDIYDNENWVELNDMNTVAREAVNAALAKLESHHE